MKGPDLQDHMAGTYFSLRWGMVVIAFVFPLLLWAGGMLLDHLPLRDSMSAYYYSETMRDVFVGVLVAIGACLYLYKGFSTAENLALNFAGLFVVGVAMIPTQSTCVGDCGTFTPHRILAVLFFASIAYVSLFRASDTLSLIQDTGKAKKFRATYRVIGVGMVLSPLLAVALAVMLRSSGKESLVFFAEAFAVWVFAAYWLVKSREMAFTQAERLALDSKLATSPPPQTPQKDGAVGKIVQTEP